MLKPLLIAASALALLACSNADAGSAATSSAQTAPAQAKAEPAKTQTAEKKLKTEALDGGFHVIYGPGGNIGLSIGEDGVYMIDDKFSDNATEILEEIAALTEQPISYLINTHLHGDHTGSNSQMKAVGATVYAHDNVRSRMQEGYMNNTFGRMNEPRPEQDLPVLTFSDTATLYFNGQTVKAIHVPHAHTDGDSLVHFQEANIIHMGDNFFHEMFPFIDMDGGGHMDGMIAAHKTALALADANTKIIPGHGPMASKADLQAAHDLLIDIRQIVQDGIDKGQTLDQIIAAKPLADKASYAKFIKEDGILTFAYKSIKAPRQTGH